MSRFLAPFFSLFVFVFLLSACAIPLKKQSYGIGYREAGLASWYGKDFHGRPTASGEIYDMFGISAAHKSLPMGTLLLVTDMQTKKRIKVKVNDRGPFVKRRILDLSYGAAKQLGIVNPGIAKIKIKVIGRAPIYLPKSKIEKHFFVQLGSYQIEANALRVEDKVRPYYQDVFVTAYKTRHGELYRVRLGPYKTEEDAQTIVAALRLKPLLNREITPIVIPNQH